MPKAASEVKTKKTRNTGIPVLCEITDGSTEMTILTECKDMAAARRFLDKRDDEADPLIPTTEGDPTEFKRYALVRIMTVFRRNVELKRTVNLVNEDLPGAVNTEQ